MILEANGGFLQCFEECCKTQIANTTKHFIKPQMCSTRCFGVFSGYRKIFTAVVCISESCPHSPALANSWTASTNASYTLLRKFCYEDKPHSSIRIVSSRPLYPVGDLIISEGKCRVGFGEAVVGLELITCPLAVESLGSIISMPDPTKTHEIYIQPKRL